ncbi:hypothetical protein KGM_203354 [Danaus plexippus plexippus]|uniref:Uncharacterized protein n=1 Tax=Danaus plexippus plexippus TaxID=278856 RepID=A0A212FJ37_DANPL|nr:hypothetical protein KGM_203354 [Danaus plexippus plexippus]
MCAVLNNKSLILINFLLFSTCVAKRKHNYQTSLYLRKGKDLNVQRFNARGLDGYEYKDWEEKLPDVYDYILPKTNVTTTTVHANITQTSPTEETQSTNPTATDSQYTELTNTTITFVEPTKAKIRAEMLESKRKLRAGFFTSSAYVLLKIIDRKRDEDVGNLLLGLNSEVIRLESLHHLAVFGTVVTTALSTMVRVMATTPIEVIRSQTKTGINMIETKKDSLNPDTNAMFDVVDAMYTDEEYHNMVDVLTDIENYPNITKPVEKISEDLIVASVLRPFSRIQGTAKAKLFLSELDRVVKSKLLIGRRRMNVRRKPGKSTVASPTFVRKSMRPKFTKPLPKVFPTPATENSTEVDYTSYVKDPKVMKKLKTKMIIYKQKFKQIRKNERKMKTKRGPTSTALLTTTTPPMRKSKYYMRKYVLKNLYKMKTTLEKTSYFTWRYHGPYKKFRPLRKFMEANDGIETERLGYGAGRSNSDLEIDEVNERDEELSRFTISMAESNKDPTKANLPESSVSEEVKLKANLKDAMYHPNNETVKRRSNIRKVNKIRIDSFSDDEALLKGNIYRVFGYSDDFAKQLRTLAREQG